MSAADQTLLNQWIARRDAQAFKELTRRYCPTVYGTSVRILRSPSDAEEITQDCFLALASIHSTLSGSLGAWLHRVATYKALNRRRAEVRRREREEQFARAQATTTEVQWNDISQFIDQSIEALPDKLRTAVVAHFIQNETVTEIASRECVTHGAISQRIQKGVEVIRERMRQNGIVLSAAVLAALLAQNAAAWPPVPASVSAALGKLAVAGTATGNAAASFFSAKWIAGVAATALIAGSAVLYAVLSQPTANATATEAAIRPTVTTPAITPPTASSSASQPVQPAVQMAANTAPRVPSTWREVVDAYKTHQDRIRRIAFEFTNTTIGPYYYPSYMPQPGNKNVSERGSLVTDGTRCAMKLSRWGDLYGNTFPADKPSYAAYAYNGDTFAQYDIGGGEHSVTPGMIQIHPNAIHSPVKVSAFESGRIFILFSAYPGNEMFGYPQMCGLRMEEILPAARSIALREKKESIRGMECYVIDADTRFGDFTVWFDPMRDYNILQFMFIAQEGDVFEKFPLEKTESVSYDYSVEQFTKVNDCWVPMISTSHHYVQRLQNSGHNFTLHHERSNIRLLAPDEDKGAYIIYSNEIRDGAELMGKIGEVQRDGDPTWRWRDGEFVLTTDKPDAVPVQRANGATGFGAGIIGGAVKP